VCQAKASGSSASPTYETPDLLTRITPPTTTNAVLSSSPVAPPFGVKVTHHGVYVCTVVRCRRDLLCCCLYATSEYEAEESRMAGWAIPGMEALQHCSHVEQDSRIDIKERWLPHEVHFSLSFSMEGGEQHCVCPNVDRPTTLIKMKRTHRASTCFQKRESDHQGLSPRMIGGLSNPSTVTQLKLH
jgi:hypothetical protein